MRNEINYFSNKNINRYQYNEIFNNSDIATPFHSLEWLDIIQETYPGIELMFASISLMNNQIAFLPYFTPKNKMHLWMYVPLGGYSGFIYEPNRREDVTIALKQIKFIKFFTRIVIFEDDIYKYCSDLYNYKNQYSTWLLDVTKGYNEIFSNNIHPKTRNQIRRAFKENIVEYKEIETMQEVQQCKILYLHLVRKHQIKSPYPLEVFDNLYRKSLVSSNIMFLIARVDSVVIAYSIFLKSKTQLFYWMNASDASYSRLNATNGLLSKVIKYSCDEMDIRTFNFGAVPPGNTGLLHFKTNWGAYEKRYGYFDSKGKIWSERINNLKSTIIRKYR
jgi:hypothetical protein